MWIRQMIPCQAVTSVQSHTWKAGTLRQHEKLEILSFLTVFLLFNSSSVGNELFFLNMSS